MGEMRVEPLELRLAYDILDLIDAPGVSPDIFIRLQQYTDNHFELEERYMQELADKLGLSQQVTAYLDRAVGLA